MSLEFPPELTKLPLMHPFRPVLPFHPKPWTTTVLKPSFSISLSKTVAMSDSDQAETTHLSQNAPTPLDNYPVPLSPPLPAISKQIELTRAMTAASNSSLFSLSASHVIYEDQWLIALNKPQGIYCETILSSVPTLLKPQGVHVSVPELHLANRLDRDTSGVTVITKSHKIAAKLVKAFTDHAVRKTYIALCTAATPPRWQRVTVRSGHGRSKFGAFRVYAASDIGRKLPGGSVVRAMETSFEVLSVNGKGRFSEVSELSEGDDVVVVEEKAAVREGGGVEEENEIAVRAYPRSGRTHQIRLHCQYLGISIRGDVKYEGVCEWKGVACDGHVLHAESLSFEHPVTGNRILLHAPLPLWANQALQLKP